MVEEITAALASLAAAAVVERLPDGWGLHGTLDALPGSAPMRAV